MLTAEQKRIGTIHYSEFSEGLEGLAFKSLVEGFGWTLEEVQMYLMGVRDDLRKRTARSMCEL